MKIFSKKNNFFNQNKGRNFFVFLFCSKYNLFQSELDVVEAMIRWIQFRPEQRKAFAERLLDCVRFVHTTSNEMLNCKRLIPELFDLGPLRTRMAKAKWTKDLLERGVAAVDVVIPGCRVNRDPCQTQKKRRPFCFSQISTQHLNFPL
jgi:hypothetical protein